MRTICFSAFLLFLALIGNAQSADIVEKRNIYTKKGDFYTEKGDYDKAILFYNMAYENDKTDYLSILKKADAYSKLALYPQAVNSYRFVFEQPVRPANSYRLKYALALQANGQYSEFKKVIKEYSDLVELEIGSGNTLVSAENRTKLYKDTAVSFVANGQSETVAFKVKYAGYKMRRQEHPEDKYLNLILSNGTEHSVAPSDGDNFEFNFQPQEAYTLLIRKENIEAANLLNKPGFQTPAPLQETAIELEPGMKYVFTTGSKKISADYRSRLQSMAGSYQSPGSDAVDLTALVKELHMAGDEVYSIRFEKGTASGYKKPEISSLTINDEAINIFGNSFFIVLPLETGVNFNVQTDLDALEKNFSPKKFAMHIDDAPVFTGSPDQGYMVALTINTTTVDGIKTENTFMGREIGMIPGTEYILTLSKPDPSGGNDIEVFVPLTQGVKYNFTSLSDKQEEYRKELAEFLLDRKDVKLADEEIINISMLSKALEVEPGEKLSFNLKPAKKMGSQPGTASAASSILMIDDKEFKINSTEKFRVNIPFDLENKLNIQTDLGYVQEHFASNAYTVRVDTSSFVSEISIDVKELDKYKDSEWLSMSVNTESVAEVSKQDQFIAKDVSILPGKEYILTISKTDGKTGKIDDIIIPLIRDVKYDFTAREGSAEEFDAALDAFLSGQKKATTPEGTMIDIKLLSKELEIEKGDAVSFSLLPVKNIYKKPENVENAASSLFLDDKVVEFTHINKYSINMPLHQGQMNVQTNLDYIQQNYQPGTVHFEVDTLSFFSEITVDTTGLGNRVVKEKITDPVFDVVIVNFEVNQHVLTPKAKQIIQDKVFNEMSKDNRLYVTITGYTDALGDADYNMKLSQKRAESVQAYLKANGVGDNRIRTFSFGAASKLEAGVNWKDLSEAELAKYRKVEIVIYLPK